MTMMVTRRLVCDQEGCSSVVQSSVSSYWLQTQAARRGWSVGSGRRRGADYCPDHASAKSRAAA